MTRDAAAAASSSSSVRCNRAGDDDDAAAAATAVHLRAPTVGRSACGTVRGPQRRSVHLALLAVRPARVGAAREQPASARARSSSASRHHQQHPHHQCRPTTSTADDSIIIIIIIVLIAGPRNGRSLRTAAEAAALALRPRVVVRCSGTVLAMLPAARQATPWVVELRLIAAVRQARGAVHCGAVACRTASSDRSSSGGGSRSTSSVGDGGRNGASATDAHAAAARSGMRQRPGFRPVRAGVCANRQCFGSLLLLRRSSPLIRASPLPAISQSPGACWPLHVSSAWPPSATSATNGAACRTVRFVRAPRPERRFCAAHPRRGRGAPQVGAADRPRAHRWPVFAAGPHGRPTHGRRLPRPMGPALLRLHALSRCVSGRAGEDGEDRRWHRFAAVLPWAPATGASASR